MQSLRHQRVRELLKRQIGEIVRREFSLDRVGLLNINEVSLASDLKSAIVFVGVVGTEAQKKEALHALQSNRKKIQSLVAGSVVLKYMPHLKFETDESVARANQVLKIIEELEQSNSNEQEER
jgi:ribosome-binding factor A